MSSETKLTAGQYYLGRINDERARLQASVDEAENAAEAPRQAFLREKAFEALQSYFFVDKKRIKSVAVEWPHQTIDIRISDYSETQTASLCISIDLTGMPEVRRDELSWKRLNAFERSRKQSVDQFIKFVKLKVPGTSKHTAADLDVLWEQWLDYLVTVS